MPFQALKTTKQKKLHMPNNKVALFVQIVWSDWGCVFY